MPTATSLRATRSDAKRRAIIAVALEVFLAGGFAATSMSEIAARVGGSKGTLYNYFRSKEELFAAVMTEACESTFGFLEALPVATEKEEMREGLIEFGVKLLSNLLRDDTIALQRIVIAETERFPALGHLFYENGPARRGARRVTEYMQRLMEAGRLPRNDPQETGRRLRDLILSDFMTRRLWGVLEPVTPEELRAHVTRSVDIFLMAFGERS